MEPTHETILSPQEQLDLIRKAKNGDSESRDQLILNNMRLVTKTLTSKISYINNFGLLTYDDLMQIGTIGLIKGIDTFNPDLNFNLSTYLVRCILNELYMAFRNYAEPNVKIVEFDERNCKKSYSFDNRIEMRIMLEDAIKYLNEDELFLYEHYFILGDKQNRISEIYNLSQPQISRKIKNIKNKLRNKMKIDDDNSSFLN